ncbi:MAG: hypothetical protein ACXVEY_10615 [Actinomycetota bacterium]
MRKATIALVFCVLGVACAAPPPPERDPTGFGAKLATAIADAYRTHQAVRVSDLTSFAWNRFYAFRPNQSPDQINRALGFPWAKDYSDQTNTYCLLVFVSDHSVTHHLLFPRYQGDCSSIGEGPYDPHHAVFDVTSSGTTTGGQPFLHLTETLGQAS